MGEPSLWQARAATAGKCSNRPHPPVVAFAQAKVLAGPVATLFASAVDDADIPEAT